MAVQEETQINPKSTRRRVKVYELDEKGEWQDKGTGHVSCSYVEKFDSICISVQSETEEETMLLETKIYRNQMFTIQQDTLIVWADPETEMELALSFQEAIGCKEIFDQIKNIQKLDEAEDYPLNNSMYLDDRRGEPMELPEPILNNLSKISDLFADATSVRRERIIDAITRDNCAYIQKLFELFHVCEDLGSTEDLHQIFSIFKHIILLNDPSLIDLLLSEDYVFELMGALEYDPEIVTQQKHREFLKTHAVFKEVVPFDNPALVSKIHQTFRIQYLKDVVLPRILDDPTFGTLNSLVFFNNVDIVGQIQNDVKFMTELFRRLKSPETTKEQLKDLVTFVQELCGLAKTLQVQNRAVFYQNICKHGFCDIFEIGLKCTDLPVRLCIVNIMDSVLGHDPSLLRSYILSQKHNYPLFHELINVFISEHEMGIRIQLGEILKLLIDTSTMDETPEKDQFLNMFYSDFIHSIVEPLGGVNGGNSDNGGNDNINDGDDILNDNVQQQQQLQQQQNGSTSMMMVTTTGTSGTEMSMIKESVIDILSFCIIHHGYRIRHFILNNNIINRVVKLSSIRDKPLTLAVVRFLRSIIGIRDDYYYKHIIKGRIFDQIVQVFIDNGSKYNLLNSAIIELFDFIKKENIKILVNHVIECYGNTFKDINYVETFKGLFTKYEQNHDLESSASTISPGSLKQSRGEDDNDEDDEEYFKDDDNKESSKPIVDDSNESNSSSITSGDHHHVLALPNRHQSPNDEEDTGIVFKPKKSPSPIRINLPSSPSDNNNTSSSTTTTMRLQETQGNEENAKRRKKE